MRSRAALPELGLSVCRDSGEEEKQSAHGCRDSQDAGLTEHSRVATLTDTAANACDMDKDVGDVTGGRNYNNSREQKGNASQKDIRIKRT